MTGLPREVCGCEISDFGKINTGFRLRLDRLRRLVSLTVDFSFPHLLTNSIILIIGLFRAGVKENLAHPVGKMGLSNL